MLHSDSAPPRHDAIQGSVISEVTEAERARAFNFESFKFAHSLAHDPMMSLPAIREFAGRMLTEKRYDQVVCVGGKTPLDGERDPSRRMHAALDALESIGTSNAWLRLTRVDEVNEDFKEITRQFHEDLSELFHQDMKSQVMRTFVTLFISSPGEVTHYHMDHTWNFLMQISGRKTVYLFDPNDPQVITQQDKERWYMEREPGIVLKDQPGGIGYDLEPGVGVHHPVNAPHWVQNGPEVSVSLSLGLCRHDATRLAKVHQANYILRRIGLRPSRPGQSKWADSVKAGLLDVISRRTPRSFDDVLFSGKRRFDRVLKLGGIRL
jgi:hypothetical protein